MRIVLLLAILAVGCESRAEGQPVGAWAVGRAACVSASRTAGAIPSGAAAGCRTLGPDAPGWDAAWNLHLCGPCNFAYDAASTAQARANGHPDACCFTASSPPPPLPPSPHS